MVVTAPPQRVVITGGTTEAPLPTPPPLQAVRFGSKEVMTLEVRGNLFNNWTAARVEQKITEAFPTFQFECTEESPIPLTVDALQFVPGDMVRIYVGGVPGVLGYITERHVGYDATNHGVQLIGVGDTYDLTNSSVPLEKLDGHDGQTWQQLANDITAHLGIQITTIGAVDNAPFEKIAIQPGEPIMQVLERYARMRNIVIGSIPTGGMAAIGENPVNSSGDLVEGGNILRANCVLRDNDVYRKIYVIGQNSGSDSANGDSTNKQVAYLDGSSTRNRYIVIPADIADTMHGIQRRAQMEKVFTEGSYIEAQITLQGWFKDYNQSEQVWRAGEYYTVNSPSLILNNVLGCAGCVYEQTQNGSITTLTMVDPLHMNGLLNYRQEVQQFQTQ